MGSAYHLTAQLDTAAAESALQAALTLLELPDLLNEDGTVADVEAYQAVLATLTTCRKANRDNLSKMTSTLKGVDNGTFLISDLEKGIEYVMKAHAEHFKFETTDKGNDDEDLRSIEKGRWMTDKALVTWIKHVQEQQTTNQNNAALI
jgi:hypothetical protein